jgi:hypothetical protein
MKPYYPRRKRSKGVDTQKQILKDLKHRISADVGTLIVFIEEGNPAKIEAAQQKAKAELLKHGTEMKKVAETMGERYARAVREYLDSVDSIVHTSAAWIDQAKIRHCHAMTENLEKQIAA